MDDLQLLDQRRNLYDELMTDAVSNYDISNPEEKRLLADIIENTIKCHLIVDSIEKSLLSAKVYEQLILSGLIIPFNTSHLTADGSKRVTWENLGEKYTDTDYFMTKFRFRPSDLRTVINALKLPPTYKCKTYVTTNLEGTLVMLRRLASNLRFSDMTREFDRTEQELSAIFRTTISLVQDSIKHKMNQLDHPLFTQENLQYWAERVEDVTEVAGIAVSAFLDGNIADISRPGKSQRLMYSGKSKTHCMKNLALVTPSGIAFFFGPEIGSKHDSGISNKHLVPQQVEQVFGSYRVYADQGFAMSRNIITPYRTNNREDLDWNNRMSKARIGNEWYFGLQKQFWRFIGDKRNLKVFEGPVGAYFNVTGHLTNILTCLRGGNQISYHFGADVPSLNSYLAGFD